MSRSETVSNVKKAYWLLNDLDFADETIFYALNLLARFLESNTLKDNFELTVAAAAYLASHKPQHVNKTEKIDYFSKLFNVDKSNLENKINQLVENLELIIFPDNKGEEYYLDKEGVEYNFIKAIAKNWFDKAVITQVIGIETFDLEALSEKLADYLTYTIKIVPSGFYKSCKNIVKLLINSFSKY